MHQSSFCGAENKQADGLIVLLHQESHLGFLIPPGLIRGEKQDN